MEVSAKERQRAEHLLQSQRIQLHQIESFSFMKRYRRDPHENIAGGKDRYGPGIFVFHLKEKQDRILHMPPFKHPSSLVRFLVSQGIPFANYSPCNRSEGTLPAETYQRPSLYMFWFFILFHQRRCLVGIHSRHTIVRAEPLLHLHADDPVLLPDIGQ